MKELPERLKQRIKELKITQSTLAAKVGLTSGQIGHYLKGRRVPPIDQIAKLEDSLNLKPGWLIYGDSILLVDTPHSKTSNVDRSPRSLPVLKPKQVFNWVKYGNLPKFYKDKDIDLIGLDKTLSARSFIMPIVGDSMISKDTPKMSLNDGDLAVIDPELMPKRGNIVIAQINNDDVIIRQYQQDGNQLILKAFDPQYHIIKVDKSVKILGVVKQRISFFEGMDK